MHIKYKNSPKILTINNSPSLDKSSIQESLVPEIMKENIKFNDQGDVESHTYKIKFFCPVNIKNWLNSAGSKIELKISNLSAADHRKLAAENPSDSLQEKIKARELSSIGLSTIPEFSLSLSKNVNQSVAMLTSTIKAFTQQSLFANAPTVTSFSFANFEKSLPEIGKEKIIRFRDIPIRKRNLKAESETNKLQETFRKKHNYLISQGMDPMFLFENSYKKTSTLLNNAGLKIKEPLKQNSYEKFLKEIFEDIEIKIQKNSSSNKNNFKVVEAFKEVVTISSVVKISKSNLEKFGENIHLIYIVKSEEGINLQVESVAISLNEMHSIRDLDSKDFQMGASRNRHSRVSKLSLGNSENKNCSIDLYVKKVENNNIVNSTFELLNEDINIPARKKIHLYDGKSSINTTPSNLGITKDILYRGTLNFKNKSYDNAKTAFSKGIKTLDNVLPTANIVALSKKGRIDIYVSNLSDNISALRIVKKRYKGRSFQKKHEFITDVSSNVISEYRVKKSSETGYKFEDYDVFDGKIYKYQIQAILNNGENKLVASNDCIELYEQPQSIIDISNTQFRRTITKNDDGEININDLDSISVTFNVKRNAPEFETVVSEIFGKQAVRIFDRELKDLRSLESFFYSIKIEKINASTGEKENLENIQINTAAGDKLNQVFSFSDEVRKNEKYFYKFTPRIKPTADLLTIVSGISESIASSRASKTANNYASLSTENSRDRLANLIISRVSDKYYTRNALSRGVITPSEIISEKQNNDLFFDASTGDIEYLTVNPIIDIDDQETVELTYISSEEVKNKSDSASDSNKQNAKFDRRYYSLNFRSGPNDYFIDYYIVFIKEEDNVYLDGVMHSRDSYENVNVYKYLVEHTGTKGIVDYYIVPVTKKGLILEPQLIHKKIIR